MFFIFLYTSPSSKVCLQIKTTDVKHFTGLVKEKCLAGIQDVVITCHASSIQHTLHLFDVKQKCVTSDCDGVVRCKFCMKFVHVVTTDDHSCIFIFNKY
jgi:hypothetical protein